VLIDEQESPLGWLARRRGRDAKALIAPHQLQAGERLRADFTLAQLMPRTTSNWESPMSSGRRNVGGAGGATERMVAARQRVSRARCCRPGIFRAAAQHLLFPERARGH
jgi:hypothetical protein